MVALSFALRVWEFLFYSVLLRVVDRATGAPIAGADVRPIPTGKVITRSAADGRFDVDGV